MRAAAPMYAHVNGVSDARPIHPAIDEALFRKRIFDMLLGGRSQNL